MNGDQVATSFWVMILLQTIGSVDMPGQGNRKLPAPRQYAAIIVAWGVLQLVADAGKEQAASTAGWVMVLAGTVVGPFGSRLISFFNTVATKLSNAPVPTSSASTTVTTPQTIQA
jgi:hypothetical protein